MRSWSYKPFRGDLGLATKVKGQNGEVLGRCQDCMLMHVNASTCKISVGSIPPGRKRTRMGRFSRPEARRAQCVEQRCYTQLRLAPKAIGVCLPHQTLFLYRTQWDRVGCNLVRAAFNMACSQKRHRMTHSARSPIKSFHGVPQLSDQWHRSPYLHQRQVTKWNWWHQFGNWGTSEKERTCLLNLRKIQPT